MAEEDTAVEAKAQMHVKCRSCAWGYTSREERVLDRKAAKHESDMDHTVGEPKPLRSMGRSLLFRP